MEMLFPTKNYSISNNIIEYRPPLSIEGIRSISTVDDAVEMERRSKFSFAVLDMLQVSPATKLALLQVRDSRIPLDTNSPIFPSTPFLGM
jgi:hypothetical protein